MRQKIGTMIPPDEPVTDLDVVFVALYNLIHEKLEEEPKKGIIVSKGNPNQRKITWAGVMEMSHMLEDFFILRKQRTGGKTCEICAHWRPGYESASHIGNCVKYSKKYVHKFNCCKKGFKLKKYGGGII